MSTHEAIELRITAGGVVTFQGTTDWLLEHCASMDLVPPAEWHGILALGLPGGPPSIIVEVRPVEVEDLPSPPDDLSELGITEAEYHDKVLFRVHDEEHIRIADGGEDYFPPSNWG
jgi:hypothetical protein